MVNLYPSHYRTMDISSDTYILTPIDEYQVHGRLSSRASIHIHPNLWFHHGQILWHSSPNWQKLQDHAQPLSLTLCARLLMQGPISSMWWCNMPPLIQPKPESKSQWYDWWRDWDAECIDRHSNERPQWPMASPRHDNLKLSLMILWRQLCLLPLHQDRR